MKQNLIAWSAAVGALPRIARYETQLRAVPSYFERLRIVNEALGPHWVFRLADVVGAETIKANRPSWYDFYVRDVDRLHCPLDPGAPETEAYLGAEYSIMDMAFYAGMGFDGYRLALETERLVDLNTYELRFNGRYVFKPTAELKAKLDAYEERRLVPKEHYYSAYGGALAALFQRVSGYDGTGVDEDWLERVAASCLILLCGGHRGCRNHLTDEAAFAAQMESLIIFYHARNVLNGKSSLQAAASSPLRAVS